MGFLSTILYCDVIETKVSGRYRQCGRSSEVAVKRGSTVLPIINYRQHAVTLYLYAYHLGGKFRILPYTYAFQCILLVQVSEPFHSS